jgi:hypothetical protein
LRGYFKIHQLQIYAIVITVLRLALVTNHF